jgi:predicted Zn-dependent peptidase
MTTRSFMQFPDSTWARALLLLGFFSLFFAPTTPSLAAASPLKDPERIQYPPLHFTLPKADRTALENGMILHTLEDRELPLVTISVVIRTGTMFDPPGKEGLAELTGQLIRTGGAAGITGNQVDERLAAMAAQLRISVARDSAVLSLSVLSQDTEPGIEILSQMLTQPLFEEEKLSLAKALKMEALRRLADDPRQLAFREFGRLMHAGSPRGSLASPGSIDRIVRDDLISFHKLFIRPDRMMLAITGDIAHGQAAALARRYFAGWQPVKRPIENPALPKPDQGKFFFLSKEIPQSIVLMGWPAPSKRDPLHHPMEVIDFIVGGGGFSSRLFQEIRTQRGLAYSTGSFYTARGEYGIWGAYAQTKTESTLEVLSLLQMTIGGLGDRAIGSTELERAKRSILNSYLFSFTGVDQIARQQLMAEYEDLPIDFLARYPDRIIKVQAEQIRSLLRQSFGKDRAVTLIVGKESLAGPLAELFPQLIRIEPDAE